MRTCRRCAGLAVGNLRQSVNCPYVQVDKMWSIVPIYYAWCVGWPAVRAVAALRQLG